MSANLDPAIARACDLLERIATAASVHEHEALQQHDAATLLLYELSLTAESDNNLLRAAAAEQRFTHNLGLPVVKLLQQMPLASRNAVKSAGTWLVFYGKALAYMLKTNGAGDAAREKVAYILDTAGVWILLCASNLQVSALWGRCVLS